MTSTWKRERTRRAYYEEMVHEVCRTLDEAFDRSVTLGTAQSPSRDIQVAVKRLATERHELREACCDLIHCLRSHRHVVGTPRYREALKAVDDAIASINKPLTAEEPA